MVMYNLIKDYYSMGLYTIDELQLFINVAWITEEQKTEIIASK